MMSDLLSFAGPSFLIDEMKNQVMKRANLRGVVVFVVFVVTCEMEETYGRVWHSDNFFSPRVFLDAI